MNSRNKWGTGLTTRACAHTILHEVVDLHRPLDGVLHSDKRLAKLNPRDRAFTHNLVATTLRRIGQIDTIIDDYLDRPLPKSAAAARNALRLGICQILFLNTQTHAAVDTSVSLAGQRGPDRFRGLVNGILRRVVRTANNINLSPEAEMANIPTWLRKSWAESFGKQAAVEIAAAHLQPPAVDLTVPADRETWSASLGGKVIGKSTVRLACGGDIISLPGFVEGAWWVQDAAAALPAQLFSQLIGGTRVVDLCAAPGGKTAQLASAGYDVTALDIAPNRLNTLSKNLQRLGLAATVVEADLLSWQPEHLFEGVLLDAPCTGTGTIRRHPDIPILKSAADVTRQSAIQKKFLDRASSLLRPGGTLVYSVCSMERPEGPDQINALLSRNDKLNIEPIRPAEVPGFEVCIDTLGCIRTTPSHMSEAGGVDGFYIARLQKKW